MVEFVKQIIEAAGDRIRSPFLGSIVLVFLVFNWQPISYLLFADKPIRARFLYFDQNTSDATLFYLPIAIGIGFAIALPWVSLIGAIFAKAPKAMMHTLQHSESVNRKVLEFEQKAKVEEAMARLEAAQEQRKIDAAKRLGEAAEVSEDLEQQLNSERLNEGQTIRKFYEDHLSNQLDEYRYEMLRRLALSTEGKMLVSSERIEFAGGGVETMLLPDHRRFSIKIEKLVNLLLENDMLRKTENDFGPNATEYELTETGYDLIELLERVEKIEPVD